VNGRRAMKPGRDVIFTFGFTAWAVASERGTFPDDRLARALLQHPRVRRVLVCDPFRSAPRKLASAAVKRRLTRFPTSSTAAHCAPIRLRSEDPTSSRGVERTYAAYERWIRRAATRHGLERPAVITSNPLLAGYGDLSWAGPVTYYGWDDWMAYEPSRRWWPAYAEAYARVRKRGRRVVAVTDAILRRIDPAGAHAVVPNGVDASEWTCLQPPPAWFADRPAPRLLYVGTLQSRVDVGQLQNLARAFPEASITLVGPVLDRKHFLPLAECANVEIRPPVGRRDVQGLIAHADVGLLPHVRSPLTEAMSPLKLYEYLVGGLPVASVDLPGTRGISGRVSLVAPGEDLAPAVRRALSMGRIPEPERLALGEAHAWEGRFRQLLDVAFDQERS
jgi:teichuronic acid biosynthesis glycosyltransferase TuaH